MPAKTDHKMNTLFCFQGFPQKMMERNPVMEKDMLFSKPLCFRGGSMFILWRVRVFDGTMVRWFKAQVVNGGSMSEDSGGLRSLGKLCYRPQSKNMWFTWKFLRFQKVWSVMGMVGRILVNPNESLLYNYGLRRNSKGSGQHWLFAYPS